MKPIFFLSIALLTLSTSELISKTNIQITTSLDPDQTEEEKEKPTEKEIVLGHFANVVGNMFNIMQNPENPQNVGANLVGIFSNIVGLAVHAIQDKLGPNATEEEILIFFEENFDNEFKKSLCDIIIKRAHKARKKILAE